MPNKREHCISSGERSSDKRLHNRRYDKLWDRIVYRQELQWLCINEGPLINGKCNGKPGVAVLGIKGARFSYIC